jgi:hypothetical protein
VVNLHNVARDLVETFPSNAQFVEFEIKRSERSDGVRPLFPAALGAAGIFDVKLHPALSLFTASIIAFAPMHAYAQDANSASVRDRARPEYDPQGMRFGGFDLHAQVDVSAATTDNLFATQSNEESDQIYTIAPSMQLASHWSRHSLQVEAGVQHAEYANNDSQNSDTGYVGARGRFDISDDTNISGSARYARDVEPRTNPDALTSGEPVRYDTTQGSVGVAHMFNRVQVSATAQHIELNYHDVGAIDQDFRDSIENAGTVNVDYAISPRLGIIGRVTLSKRKYDNDPGLSSNNRTYLVGARINFTDLMQGEVAVGQFDRDYDFGTHVKGTAVDASLDWYITELTTLSFNANRDPEEQGADIVLPYVESRYGARVDHELLRNLILSADFTTSAYDYRTIDRNDDFTSGGIGAKYILNRRVALNASYRYDKVDSSGVDRYRNYIENTFTIGLSLRL